MAITITMKKSDYDQGRLCDGTQSRSRGDIYELKERLLICKAVIAHLLARKETRWHSFNENLDHPDRDEAYDLYVNSKLENGEVVTFHRKLVKENTYEHTN